MDTIFALEERDRSAFLIQMMQSFDCVHICLWSYLPPPSNCLLALDGLCGEISNQPNPARRLFDLYRESVIYVDTGRIPGHAFKNNIPYMELKLHDFHRLVSSEMQLQFYQEAGITTVVFVGCAMGEIELGFRNDPQVDMESEIKNMVHISGQAAMSNQRPSSSSSSLRSLSVESSPLLFNIPSSSFPLEPSKESLIGDALSHEALTSARTTITNVQLPTVGNEDDVMAKAFLAVLTSPSTSSSSQHTVADLSQKHNPSAFRRYPTMASTLATAIPPKQNKFKKAVSFFRNMNWRRRSEDLQVHGNRPTASQLHHMISERRRREKLNESFHVLRSLLPLESKKDKASVLSSTTEYLSSLKSQVEELIKRNQMLESQLSGRKMGASSEAQIGNCSPDERIVNVKITQVSSSSTVSEGRYLDLSVTVRGESSMLELVIRLLEFLKQQQNVTLLSVESNTRMSETITVHGVILRLKIEGDEFDEPGFEEGVRRVVDDQSH